MSVFGALGGVTRLINAAPLAVQVLQPARVANPNLTGEQSLNWAAPIIIANLKGALQTASTKALERVGRIGAVGVWSLYTTPGVVTPLGRVRISSQQYVVLEVRTYATHNELVVEEVSV